MPQNQNRSPAILDGTFRPGSVFKQWGIGDDAAKPQASDSIQEQSEDGYKPGTVFQELGIDPRVVSALAPEIRNQEARSADELPVGTGLVRQAIAQIPIVGPLLNMGAAATGAAKDKFTDSNKSFWEQYQARIHGIEGENRLFQSRYPAASKLAGFSGAAASSIPFAATNVGARALGLVGETLPIRMVTGGVGSGTIGAADSYLRGENPLVGGAIGFTFGAGAPVAQQAARSSARAAANVFYPRIGTPLEGINRQGRNMLLNVFDGETPQSVAQTEARIGPHGFLAQINSRGTDLAGSLADRPETKEMIRGASYAREAGRRERIEKSVTEALGPRINLATLTRGEKAARKEAADPLYEQFRSMKIHPTDEIKALIPILEEDGLLASANRLMKLEGKPVQQNFFVGGDRKSWPTAEAVDYVKQAIDGRIGEALRSGNNNVARVYGGLKRRLDDVIANHPDKEVSRVWNKARESWGNPTAIMRAREAGQDVWKRNVRTDELAYELTDYSRPERIAYVQGARDSLGQMMDTSVRGDTTVKNLLLAPANEEKLNWLSGRHGYSPNKLIQNLEMESAHTGFHQNVAGGSQTTPKAVRLKMSDPQPMFPAFSEYVSQFNPYHPATWVTPFSPGAISSGIRATSAETGRRQIAPMMVMTASESRNKLIEAILAEQSRLNRASQVGGSVGSVIGGAVSGPGAQMERSRRSSTSE